MEIPKANNTELKKHQPKKVKIKVPVFTTASLENDVFSDNIETLANQLFPNNDYDSMNEVIISKIDRYKTALTKENFVSNNKRITIEKINYTKHELDGVPCLLLKVTSFETDFFDGFIEDKKAKRRSLDEEDKIGSDTNFIFFYPIIDGDRSNNYIKYYLILVYQDPTKSAYKIIGLTKCIAKDIINIKMKNIKLPAILDELNSEKAMKEFKMLTFNTQEYTETDITLKEYSEYIKKPIIETRKIERVYKNVPNINENIAKLINHCHAIKEKFRLIIKKDKNVSYVVTNKEKIDDVKREFEETCERIFNEEVYILRDDLENGKCFGENFVVDKLKGVITKYLTNVI